MLIGLPFPCFQVENIPAFIAGVKAKKEKLFGFGHRVYRNFDPRANIIKEVAEEVFTITGRDPLIEIAKALQEAALADEYFAQVGRRGELPREGGMNPGPAI